MGGFRNLMPWSSFLSGRGLLGLFVITAVVAMACTGQTNAADTDVKIGTEPGDLAPDFELTLFETENHRAGETLRLSDLKGRPVVVNFWFPSCPPCVAEMPDLEETFQAHREDGVEFVGVQLVGLDTVEDGQDFVDSVGVTYALGADEDGTIIINDYQVSGFPTTLFLNRERRVVRKWTGALNAEKMEELVQEILN